MLRSLTITNYALIEHTAIQFEGGLTAITGETGSGKSILLGAFGLLLGERADSKSIKDENAKCIVEAVFELNDPGFHAFFETNDLDFEQLTTIRREIAPGGKSRAFINDTPVPLTTLKQLGSELVDIHSQHENSLLGNRTFQFQVADAFANNHQLLNQYTAQFNAYKSAQKMLEECLANESQTRRELEFNQYQWEELDKIQLHEINQVQLEQELDTLQHGELIKSQLSQVQSLLDDEQHGAMAAITSTKSILQKLASYNQHLTDFAQRMESCAIDLRELTREIEAYADEINTDEKKLDFIQEKLSLLYNLQKKHNLQTVEELIQLKNELQQKIDNAGNLDTRIATLQQQVLELEAQLDQLADKLHQSRLKAAQLAQQEVKKYFAALSLEHAEIQIELQPATTYNAWGKSEIDFLFKANKGSKLQPIEKVASGGEISRVMLAIKASISKHKRLPVLILDEIDQGVSGEVGKKIGEILKEMSLDTQLITITHLPQIAAKAGQQLKVYKSTNETSTITQVMTLNDTQRIHELAEMLSGKNISQAALENARELML